MKEKNTKELTDILGKTHAADFERFRMENEDSLISSTNDFPAYMKQLLGEKGITQQTAFLNADIPERYGYKLLSGEKHTRQRDIILRICYAGMFNLEETQRALRKYSMPELYPKNPRDALLMILFNEHIGSILDVNALLKDNGFEPLRTSGAQD